MNPYRENSRRLFWFTGFSLVGVFLLALVYSSLLKPIFIATILAYLFVPVIRWIENKGVRSRIAVFCVVFMIVLIALFFVARLIPITYAKVMKLLALAPAAAFSVESHWLPLMQEFVDSLGLAGAVDLHESFAEFNYVDEIRRQLQQGLMGIWVTGASFLGGMLNVALVPLIAFFLLVERHNIKFGLHSFVPLDWGPAVKDVTTSIDHTLRNVIKGQVTVAGILTILYIIGFGIVNILFGFPSALTIAIIVGACRVVPYLDIFVGAILSSIVILSDFQNWGQVIGVVGVITMVQTIDGMYITPRVIGEKVGLHPLAVILSVLAFADWFGFWGVLMAIPLVAVAKIIFMALMPLYKQSGVFERQQSN